MAPPFQPPLAPSRFRLFLIFFLILPSLLSTFLYHICGLSATAHIWSLKTELIVAFVRRLLDPRTWGSIVLQQATSLQDWGIKGQIWISKVTLTRPEYELEGKEVVERLAGVIEGMSEGKGGGEAAYTVPKLEDVTAEWTGYRAGVDLACPRPDLSEAQHYERLMEEVSSDVTILYFHGGAFYLGDPCTHRFTTGRLAQLTRGRCLSVRYRLSPQYAFPSALLDCFVAYLSLLSPPPGSYHAPVDPSKIVICGDSAGGNLALVLLQLLLHLKRKSPSATIRFHNREVPLSLPAGVATNSAWSDLTRCLPSSVANVHYDYLLPPPRRREIARFPSFSFWPTDPGRGDLYCDISMLCHPLASPVVAPDWRGSCPLWFCYGEEALLDDGKMLAARAAQQDVKVMWEEWEAMPHVFAQILIYLPAARKCFENWATFCTTVVEQGAKGVDTKGVKFAVKTMAPSEVDVRALAVMSDEELKRKMQNAARANEEVLMNSKKITPGTL